VNRRLARALDNAMEATIAPSFTSIGYRARRGMYRWRPLDDYDLSGRTVVLSGATSGIGLAGARQLARMGAMLVLIARDADKAAALRDELQAGRGGARVQVVIADLGDPHAVRRAAAEVLERHPVVHALLHNAGGMFSERRTAANGVELTSQVMVIAPFVLTTMLLPALRAAGDGRVLTMSSGGMYTARVHGPDLQMGAADYNAPRQYARAKRAQVVLSELWSRRERGVAFHSLHPGWVDTPGIADALPGFHRLVGPLLRTPEEGADTMVWLTGDRAGATTTGRFWLDRAPRPTHRLRSTRRSDTAAARESLWQWCERTAALS
jgi:dehydrogenase/reductase SDR family protein 12